MLRYWEEASVQWWSFPRPLPPHSRDTPFQAFSLPTETRPFLRSHHRSLGCEGPSSSTVVCSLSDSRAHSHCSNRGECPNHVPARFVLAAKATLHPLHLPRAMSNTGEHTAPVVSQEGAHSTAEVWEGRRAEEAEKKAIALSSEDREYGALRGRRTAQR